MRITCGDRVLEHHCLREGERSSCMCHVANIQFGELVDGCCAECSCPKTPEAFDRLYKEKHG